MASRNPKDVFWLVLSDVRRSRERAAGIYDEIGKLAQDPEVKQALGGVVVRFEKTLEKLDQCFMVFGE